MALVICVVCSASGGGDVGQAYNCHACLGSRTMRGPEPDVVPLFDLKSLAFKETTHYNGGKAWFGYDHRCVQLPSLTVHNHCDKKTRRCTQTWRVDGVDQPNLAAALVLLAQEVQP